MKICRGLLLLLLLPAIPCRADAAKQAAPEVPLAERVGKEVRITGNLNSHGKLGWLLESGDKAKDRTESIYLLNGGKKTEPGEIKKLLELLDGGKAVVSGVLHFRKGDSNTDPTVAGLSDYFYFQLAECTIRPVAAASPLPDPKQAKETAWPDGPDLARLHAVKGFKPAEVIAFLGHPKSVEKMENGKERWNYPYMAAAFVDFRDGVVTNTFYTAGY